MRDLFPFSLMAIVLAASLGVSHASESPNIRAGHEIAVTSCIACHVVSRGQTILPVLGAGIPSFEAIARRPETTADSLQTAMKIAGWHDYAMTKRPLPMNRLSDVQRGQVAAYIMSLRAQP
jgi:mono/diheme cytochrome c family protein